jgi:hypothetical protein
LRKDKNLEEIIEVKAEYGRTGMWLSQLVMKLTIIGQ